MHSMQGIDLANLKMFVEQQFSLINELRKTYPELGNDKFLFSLPEQGVLTLNMARAFGLFAGDHYPISLSMPMKN
jgi:hypothetical protein